MAAAGKGSPRTSVVPVVGLADDDVEQWRRALESFLVHGKTADTVRKLSRLFKGDGHYGLLASLVIMQSAFGHSSKFRHKLSVMEVIQFSDKVAVTLYRKLKDHKHETGIEQVFWDCKQRLALLLENECGCVDCQRLASVLQRDRGVMRPPNLNPHQKHSQAATFLTWIYNQAVLNLNVAVLEDQIEVLFIKPDEFFDFAPDMRDELSLLTSCLHFCWLHFILKHYVHLELDVIQEHIANTCEKLGVPPVNSLGQVQTLLGSLSSSLLRRKSHLHEVPHNTVHYDPLSEVHSHMSRRYTLTPQTLAKISSLVPRKLSQFQKEHIARRLRLGRRPHPPPPSHPPPRPPPLQRQLSVSGEVGPVCDLLSDLSLLGAAGGAEDPSGSPEKEEFHLEISDSESEDEEDGDGDGDGQEDEASKGEEDEDEFKLEISDSDEEGEEDGDGDDEAGGGCGCGAGGTEEGEDEDDQGIEFRDSDSDGEGSEGAPDEGDDGGDGNEERDPGSDSEEEEVRLEISDSDDEEEGGLAQQVRFRGHQGAVGGRDPGEGEASGDEGHEGAVGGYDPKGEDPFYDLKEFEELLQGDRPDRGRRKKSKSKKSKVLDKSGYYRESV
ncbi:tegument protein G48 [Equid gammaherpesvirus 2]|nr:tegument protein G48 [Equid gammaherpesvirus 2]